MKKKGRGNKGPLCILLPPHSPHSQEPKIKNWLGFFGGRVWVAGVTKLDRKRKN